MKARKAPRLLQHGRLRRNISGWRILGKRRRRPSPRWSRRSRTDFTCNRPWGSSQKPFPRCTSRNSPPPSTNFLSVAVQSEQTLGGMPKGKTKPSSVTFGRLLSSSAGVAAACGAALTRCAAGSGADMSGTCPLPCDPPSDPTPSLRRMRNFLALGLVVIKLLRLFQRVECMQSAVLEDRRTTREFFQCCRLV